MSQLEQAVEMIRKLSKLEQAFEAIRKLPSTYAKRHAAAIAEAATFANTDLQGARNVRAVIGHTAVGSRNVVEWTLIARRAAGMIDERPADSCAAPLDAVLRVRA